MTSKYDKNSNSMMFDCDKAGCRVNFQSESGQFKDGWREARAHGWVYVPEYEGGVSRPRHYCPEHAKQFG